MSIEKINRKLYNIFNMTEEKQPIADLLRTELAKQSWEFDQEKERRYYVSDMGKCMRMRWVKRHGIRSEFEPLVNWILQIGNLYHDWAYKVIQNTGRMLESEVAMRTEHWSGRFDSIFRTDPEMITAPSQQILEQGYGKHVVDFKSINGWKLANKIMKGEGLDENLKQLKTYLLMLRDEGRTDLDDLVMLVFMNKEPHSDRAPTDFYQISRTLTDSDEKELREEMSRMVDYWMSKQVPPCTCEGWAKGPKYNNYYGFCSASEAEVKSWLSLISEDRSLFTDKTGIYLVDNAKQFDDNGKRIFKRALKQL